MPERCEAQWPAPVFTKTLRRSAHARLFRRSGRRLLESASVAHRIVRVWKGYGTVEGVDQYCREHFSQTVLPQLRALKGFLDATVLTRAIEGETEVVVATVWDSVDSVRAFAGESYDKAVVEPIVHDLLQRFDDHVAHFSIAASAD